MRDRSGPGRDQVSREGTATTVIDPWQIVDDYRRSREHIVISVQVLRAQGVRAAEIAERMGITPFGVYQILRRGEAKR